MAAVDVGVGHQDDLVVAELLDVEVPPLADAAAERRDERADLREREHLVEARALDVEDLALEREDGLKLPVAPLLRRAAGAVALDDVDLGSRRDRATGSRRACRTASCSRAAPLRTTSRALRAASRAFAARIGLLEDLPRRLRVLLEELAELVVDRRSRRCALTSLDTSLLFVCESKLGSGCLMLMTAVRPSRMSSPCRPFFTSLKRFCAVP